MPISAWMGIMTDDRSTDDSISAAKPVIISIKSSLCDPLRELVSMPAIAKRGDSCDIIRLVNHLPSGKPLQPSPQIDLVGPWGSKAATPERGAEEKESVQMVMEVEEWEEEEEEMGRGRRQRRQVNDCESRDESDSAGEIENEKRQKEMKESSAEFLPVVGICTVRFSLAALFNPVSNSSRHMSENPELMSLSYPLRYTSNRGNVCKDTVDLVEFTSSPICVECRY
ncbi:hypothetical protein PAMA_013013 [Pampus argenteus]